MAKSNQTLYFKFKKLLFKAKEVLLDDNGKQKDIKEIDKVEIRQLFVLMDSLRTELLESVYE